MGTPRADAHVVTERERPGVSPFFWETEGRTSLCMEGCPSSSSPVSLSFLD